MGEEIVISQSREDLPGQITPRSILDAQLLELAEVRNPEATPQGLALVAEKLKSEIAPVFVYFPWRSTILEMLPENEFIELKTNRNKLLITEQEQLKLYEHTSVSIAGMSVGGSLLTGLVGSTIAKNLLIADFDSYSTSNLNRVQATVLDVGQNKAVVAKRKALEMNPFLTITCTTNPVNEDTVQDFLMNGDASVVFEEIDDFKTKVLIRQKAKSAGIPVVMLTNLGDSVQIDIERYDADPATPLFNGAVDQEVLSEIMSTKEVSIEHMKRFSVQLVEGSMIPQRALDTLSEIGKTLVGRPQLYSTVALDAGIAPYLVRRLLIRNDIASGRYFVSLEDIDR